VDVERGTPSSVETSFSCGGDGGGGSSSSAVYRVFCNTVNTHLLSSARRKNAYFACSDGVNEGRDSAVGIATRYGLDGFGIESRWG
jgi:hypothetical protein